MLINREKRGIVITVRSGIFLWRFTTVQWLWRAFERDTTSGHCPWWVFRFDRVIRNVRWSHLFKDVAWEIETFLSLVLTFHHQLAQVDLEEPCQVQYVVLHRVVVAKTCFRCLDFVCFVVPNQWFLLPKRREECLSVSWDHGSCCVANVKQGLGSSWLLCLRCCTIFSRTSEQENDSQWCTRNCSFERFQRLFSRSWSNTPLFILELLCLPGLSIPAPFFCCPSLPRSGLMNFFAPFSKWQLLLDVRFVRFFFTTESWARRISAKSICLTVSFPAAIATETQHDLCAMIVEHRYIHRIFLDLWFCQEFLELHMLLDGIQCFSKHTFPRMRHKDQCLGGCFFSKSVYSLWFHQSHCPIHVQLMLSTKGDPSRIRMTKFQMQVRNCGLGCVSFLFSCQVQS